MDYASWSSKISRNHWNSDLDTIPKLKIQNSATWQSKFKQLLLQFSYRIMPITFKNVIHHFMVFTSSTNTSA